MLDGFKKFILRGNVVDLAVGIVVGAAFNTVVLVFVKGVFTPFLGILGGIPDFSNFAVKIGASKILLGEFLNALLSFLIVATAIYFFVIVPMNKLKDIAASKKKSDDPTEQKCPYCLTEIPALASRCSACTSQIPQDKKK